MCVMPDLKVLEGMAPVAVLEAQSMKIQRVVRCSMSAELCVAHGSRILLHRVVELDSL